MKKKPRFDEIANRQLVANQHRFDLTMRLLRRRNGIKCYIKDRPRAEKAVQHYLAKYDLIKTTVERFWYLYGTCMLIGKAN